MFLRKFIILFSLIITGSAFSGQFDAKVIKVIDGDTIWVKTENKHVKNFPSAESLPLLQLEQKGLDIDEINAIYKKKYNGFNNEGSLISER